MKFPILFLLCFAGCAHQQKDKLLSELLSRHSVAKEKKEPSFPTETITGKNKQAAVKTFTDKHKQGAKDCKDKGIDILFEKPFALGLKGRKLSKTALKVLGYFEKNPLSHCPSTCRQKNTFRSLIKIAPMTWIKNSCPAPESKEVYSFKKTWTAPPAIEARKQPVREYLEHQMSEWILNTFVYPYVPGARYQPTKEVHSHRIKDACPSCSFYFNYNYFYESDNRLKLDIQVTCGDRKKGLSFSRKAQLQIQNHWQCLKPF